MSSESNSIDVNTGNEQRDRIATSRQISEGTAANYSNINNTQEGGVMAAPLYNSGGVNNIHLAPVYQYSQKIPNIKFLFYGVPAQNNTFVNRSSIMTNMKEALSSSTFSSECKILALKGLGGMGKTQLMLRYCYQYRAMYDFVFWLEVDSWSAVVESFRQLAIYLDLDEEAVKEADLETKAITRVHSWLQERTKWLLLLNNADDEKANKRVFELLPREGGHIILTTRLSNPRGAMTAEIQVDKMEKEEALFLLHGVSSMDSINQQSSSFLDAEKIVHALDYMPLAIALSHAYVDDALLSFKDYLNKFKESKERVILLRYKDEDNYSNYKHTVATVWQLSFEHIQTKNPTAVKILEACAFLQAENIPVNFFKQQYAILELLPNSAPPTPSEEKSNLPLAVGRAIKVLIKFFFVTPNKSKDNEEYLASDLLTIHRLVQRVIYDTMDNKERLRWARNLVTALNNEACFSDSDIYAPLTRKIMSTYLSHIFHFVTLLDDDSQNFATPLNDDSQKLLTSEDLSRLLDRGIRYRLKNGTYFGLEKLAQFSVRVSRAAYGSGHLDTVTSLMNHAKIYQRRGNYAKAEELFKQALEIQQGLEPQSLNTAKSLNYLAILYKNWAKYDKAEPLHEQALKIRKEKLAPDHEDTAASLNNLAVLYRNQGKFDKALELCNEALIMRKKVLDTHHPDTMQTLNNLANIYKDLGNYEKAESLCKDALVNNEEKMGPDHLYTACSMDNLAEVYKNQGKYDGAKKLFEKALAIREKALGSENPDPDIARSLDNVAKIYCCKKRYDVAKPLCERALGIRMKTFGSEHLDTAWSMNNLALLYKNWYKCKEADQMFKEDKKMIESKYEEAEKLFKKSKEIREKLLGSDHPDVAQSLINLASLYQTSKKHDEAETLYKQALTIWKRALESGQAFSNAASRQADALTILGDLCTCRGDYREAREWYEQALTIWEKANAASKVADVEKKIDALTDQEKYEEP